MYKYFDYHDQIIDLIRNALNKRHRMPQQHNKAWGECDRMTYNELYSELTHKLYNDICKARECDNCPLCVDTHGYLNCSCSFIYVSDVLRELSKREELKI